MGRTRQFTPPAAQACYDSKRWEACMRLFACVGLACGFVVMAASCGSPNKGFGDGGGNDGSQQFGDAGISDVFQGCATGQYQAHQQPAAMLVLLQKSRSEER